MGINWKNVGVVIAAFYAARIVDRYVGISRMFSAAA